MSLCPKSPLKADIHEHDKFDAHDPDRTCAWPTLAAPPLCAGWYVSTNNSRSNPNHDALSGWVRTVKLKIAPLGRLAVTHNRPPCASMIERQIDSPMPKPSGFVV